MNNSNNRFRRFEPPRKFIYCPCGKQAKLIKRRNFPFGRNSVARTSMTYNCLSCNRQSPLAKPAGFKR